MAEVFSSPGKRKPRGEVEEELFCPISKFLPNSLSRRENEHIVCLELSTAGVNEAKESAAEGRCLVSDASGGTFGWAPLLSLVCFIICNFLSICICLFFCAFSFHERMRETFDLFNQRFWRGNGLMDLFFFTTFKSSLT